LYATASFVLKREVRISTLQRAVFDAAQSSSIMWTNGARALL